MSQNQIETINENLFNGLVNLQTVNLFKNKIKTINQKLFKTCAKIYEIDLSENELSALELNTFKGLMYLNHIALHKNKWKSDDKLQLTLEKSVEFVSFREDFDENNLDLVNISK